MKKGLGARGLNRHHPPEWKRVFKSMATEASSRRGPWGDWFRAKVKEGADPALARLTLARKLAVWKKGRKEENTTRKS